jgi:hypothetical protein
VLSINEGILALLDKQNCMDAEAFVFAPDDCGGTPSEYTKSILGARVDAGRPKGEPWAGAPACN